LRWRRYTLNNEQPLRTQIQLAAFLRSSLFWVSDGRQESERANFLFLSHRRVPPLYAHMQSRPGFLLILEATQGQLFTQRRRHPAAREADRGVVGLWGCATPREKCITRERESSCTARGTKTGQRARGSLSARSAIEAQALTRAAH
jgi:hypothetical protein